LGFLIVMAEESNEVREVLIKEEGVDLALLMLLRDVGEVLLVEKCLGLLLYLTEEGGKGRDRFVELGGIEAIVECMETHGESLDVQEWCCGLLLNLTKDPTLHKRVVDERGGAALQNTTKSFPDSQIIQEWGTQACSNLAKFLHKETTAKVYADRASLCLAEGDLSETLSLLTEAIELDDQGEYRLLRATAHFAAQDVSAAAEDVGVWGEGETAPEAFSRRAGLLALNGDLAGARMAYEEGLERHPYHLDLMIALRVLEGSSPQKGARRKSLDRSTRQSPKGPPNKSAWF